jgi:hypothetical protein
MSKRSGFFRRGAFPKALSASIGLLVLTLLTLAVVLPQLAAASVVVNMSDYPSLQAAIDDCYAQGGGTVMIPAGTFTFNSAVWLKTGVSLQGAGIDASVLTMPVQSDYNNLLYGSSVSSVAIRDLTLTSPAATGHVFAIHVSSYSDVTIERIKVTSCEYALKADIQGSNLTVRDFTVRECGQVYVSNLTGGLFENLDIEVVEEQIQPPGGGGAVDYSALYLCANNHDLQFNNLRARGGSGWTIQLWSDYGPTEASDNIEFDGLDVAGWGPLALGYDFSDVRVYNAVFGGGTERPCVRLYGLDDVLIQGFSATGGTYFLQCWALATNNNVTLRDGIYPSTDLVDQTYGQITNLVVDNVWQTLDEALTRFEQTDPDLAYAGYWDTLTNPLASGGSFGCGEYTGASVTVEFTGKYLSWITKKHPNYGMARVTLDGGDPVMVDLYDANEIWQQKVWETGILPNGSHTVLIEWTGEKNPSSGATVIGLDALDVWGALEQAQTPNSLNVVDYGATPDHNDGGTNNDCIAFQACISAAAQQGKSVNIPAGTFDFPSLPISLVSGVSVQGAGIDQTILEMPAQDTYTNLLGGVDVSNVAVRDMTLASTAADGMVLAVHLSGYSGVTVERVKVTGCEYALKADTQGANLTVRDFTVRECGQVYVSNLTGSLFEDLDIEVVTEQVHGLDYSALYLCANNHDLQFNSLRARGGSGWTIQLWSDYGPTLASDNIEFDGLDVAGWGPLALGYDFSDVRIYNAVFGGGAERPCIRLYGLDDVIVQGFSATGGTHLLQCWALATNNNVTLDNGTYFGTVLVDQTYGTINNLVVGDDVYAVPTVTGRSPVAGPLAGGTTVTINGTNFTGATAVAFGATAATSFTVNSSTKITAVAPAHAAGTVQIKVTTPAGASANTSADDYTYQAVPTVTGRTPTTGPKAGGTTVTITGTRFTNVTAVKFGGINATSFTVVSSTKITAKAPAHAVGTVQIKVTTLGGSSANTSADDYTYY